MDGNNSGETDSSEGCLNVTPSINEIFQVYFSETWTAVLLILAFISTSITLLLYVYALVKIRQHNPFGSGRRRALTLVFGLFPVFALASLCGIIIPRAAYTVEWGASIFLAITIYSFLGLLMEYFGGAEAMIQFFKVNKVSYAQPPLACCCVCLPKVYMTERQFYIAYYLVLQVTIIRPVCVFLGAILWSDAVRDFSVIRNPDAVNFWLGTVAGISTALAVYGIQIFSKSSDHYLKKFYVKTKLAAVQLVLILTSIVAFVLDMMSFNGAIKCQPDGPFSSPEKVQSLLVYHIIKFTPTKQTQYMRKSFTINLNNRYEVWPVHTRILLVDSAQVIYNHVTIHIMALCITGIFIYWIWFSQFSKYKADAENVPEVPTAEHKMPEMPPTENKISRTEEPDGNGS